MVEPTMRTIHFKCPDCGKVGLAAEMQGRDGYRIVQGFHVSTRDGYLTVECDCGAKVLPQGNSN